MIIDDDIRMILDAANNNIHFWRLQISINVDSSSSDW